MIIEHEIIKLFKEQKMKKQSKLTSVEVIVGSCILVFSFILIHLVLTTPVVKMPSHQVICATNLKGLGMALMVYSQDYDDEYPKLGHGPWAKELGYSYEDTDFKPYDYEGPCTITSSLYLLVREADVTPRSFICPQQTKQTEFEGQHTKGLDLTELWDFGPDPYKHICYAYHNPYGRYPANGKSSAFFAVMADMNPWLKDGEFLNPNKDKNLPPQIINITDDSIFEKSNSLNHTELEENYLIFFKRKRQYPCGPGQNVLFGDGHVSYEKQPNVGVNNDNIYTFWSTEENPTEQDIQGGTAPTSRSPENDAKSTTDSFLAI
jgi:prepilin-type processing-associated H-X9-DG protein